ncbi:stalk domain-containing protein [Paenibacillus rubinfantis]|uniref:stalk domain-containing protein n=1 Tax=Paenibacillus rubinfantis TaxID=1720296 RepID=UPI000AFE4A3D|nr:stalk domain-containing protein [Paenibacillus rubinfantis]
MKKWLITIGLFSMVLLSYSAGASAASTLERIQANLNHGISFLLNGSAWVPKDANGNKAVPISYQGTTYVPLRAVAEATGAEVSFDQSKQQIVINVSKDQEGSQLEPGQRRAFSDQTVKHIKNYANSGVTRNKEELLFGETQYKEAFVVNEVNVAKQDFAFAVPSGTKRIGVLIGYKDNEDHIDRKANYTILDSKGASVSTGKVEDGKVLSNEIVTNGETEFKVVFESGSTLSVGAGYIIWDESWIEN